MSVRDVIASEGDVGWKDIGVGPVGCSEEDAE